jgi:hypothetical protein
VVRGSEEIRSIRGSGCGDQGISRSEGRRQKTEVGICGFFAKIGENGAKSGQKWGKVGQKAWKMATEDSEK